MPHVSPDALHAALETVIDPEIRKPVTELGMVESVTADDAGHVAVTILLTVAACPLKDKLTKDDAQGVMATAPSAGGDVEGYAAICRYWIRDGGTIYYWYDYC